jgi:5-formyltetrahydrofolate cyclo-ligase
MAQSTKTKVELRKEFLAKRNALDAAARTRDSSLIRQRVFQHSAWKNAEILLCYVSFNSEVETHLLIQEALRFKKRIVVPLHDPVSKETPLSELRFFRDLGPDHRGVLQVKPECRSLIDPANITLALIPGIVFDTQGGRIGFGGGYFDRLLPLMPKTFRLGLGFSAQISTVPLPLESYDVRLHAIITEKNVIPCGPWQGNHGFPANNRGE